MNTRERCIVKSISWLFHRAAVRACRNPTARRVRYRPVYPPPRLSDAHLTARVGRIQAIRIPGDSIIPSYVLLLFHFAFCFFRWGFLNSYTALRFCKKKKKHQIHYCFFLKFLIFLWRLYIIYVLVTQWNYVKENGFFFFLIFTIGIIFKSKNNMSLNFWVYGRAKAAAPYKNVSIYCRCLLPLIHFCQFKLLNIS